MRPLPIVLHWGRKQLATPYAMNGLLMGPQFFPTCSSARTNFTLGFSEKYKITIRRVGLRRFFAEKTVNRYKIERLIQVGPDLACLEWLMNCGSPSVLMSDGETITTQRQMRKYLSNMGFDTSKKNKTPDPQLVKEFSFPGNQYHAIVSDAAYDKRWANIPSVHIKEVDATDAALCDEGFQYFIECRKIEKLKMNFSDYFGDEAIIHLASGRACQSLVDLEIALNSRMSDASVPYLSKLRALRRLHLYFLPCVVEREAMQRQLRLNLPRCKVTFPKLDIIGYGYEQAQKEEMENERRKQKRAPTV